jgi:hemolysin activation/secretion protein
VAFRRLPLGFAVASLVASPAEVYAQAINPGLLLDQQLQQRQQEEQRQDQLRLEKQRLDELKKQEFDRQLVPDPCASPSEPQAAPGSRSSQPPQSSNGWPQSAWQPNDDGPQRPLPADPQVRLGGVIFRGTNDYGVLDNGKPLLDANLPPLFLQLRERFSAFAKSGTLTVSQLDAAQKEAHAELNRQGYVLSQVLFSVDREVVDIRRIKAGDQVEVLIVPSFLESLRLCEGGNARQAYVRKMLQPVVTGGRPKQVFNINDLERQLWLIRNFGGVEFSPVLRRGRIFGGTELVGKVKPIRTKFGILSDNNVPLQLGSWRLGASVDGTVPSVQPVRVSLIGNNAFPVPGGFVDGFLSMTTPLGNQGWTGEFLWGTTSTNAPKDQLAGSTGGTSNYWSVGANYPLLMRRDRGLQVGIKGTLQNSNNDFYLTGIPSQNLSTDRIRAVRFSLDGYLNSPPVLGRDGRYSLGRSSQFGVLLSQGFPGLGSDLPASAVPSNPNAGSSFTTARFNVAHYQDLSRYKRLNDKLTTISLATFRGTAQLSGSAVPVPEQFNYGGPFYGRGFNSSYIQGDQGWAVSLELGQRFLFNPEGLTSQTGKTYIVEPFVWVDYGSTSNRTSVQAGGLPSQAASTYGVGLRSSVLGGTSNVELGLGIPATNTLEPAKTGIENSIVYFKLRIGF